MGMMMLAVDSSAFRANGDKAVPILFIYCLIVLLAVNIVKMRIRYLALHRRARSGRAFVALRRGRRAGADQI